MCFGRWFLPIWASLNKCVGIPPAFFQIGQMDAFSMYKSEASTSRGGEGGGGGEGQAGGGGKGGERGGSVKH